MSSKITFRTETTTINRPPRRPTKTGQQQKSISWFAHAPIVDQLSPIPNQFSDLYIHSTVNANLGPSKQTLGTEWSIPISHIMFQLHTLCMCEKFWHITNINVPAGVGALPLDKQPLASLSSTYSKLGRALEHAFIAVNSTSMHSHAYQKYSGSLQSSNTSLLRTL